MVGWSSSRGAEEPHATDPVEPRRRRGGQGPEEAAAHPQRRWWRERAPVGPEEVAVRTNSRRWIQRRRQIPSREGGGVNELLSAQRRRRRRGGGEDELPASDRPPEVRSGGVGSRVEHAGIELGGIGRRRRGGRLRRGMCGIDPGDGGVDGLDL